jgi:hypothetical protein
LRFENEKQLGYLSSPEYFPYHPSWGRVAPALNQQLRDSIVLLDQLKTKTPAPQHRNNLDWLADNFRFTLLLDEVGRKMEPAYALKEKYLRGEITGSELVHQAQSTQHELASAPMEQLFQTFARRVRSRGELGELSSLNQRVWTQYRELETFLSQSQTVK